MLFLGTSLHFVLVLERISHYEFYWLTRGFLIDYFGKVEKYKIAIRRAYAHSLIEEKS